MLAHSKTTLQRPSNRARLQPNVSVRKWRVSRAAAQDAEAPVPIRVMTDFAVYKGKAAVQFRPIPPTFTQQYYQEGGYMGYTLDREGVLLLEFANVLPSQGGRGGPNTVRSYDWSNKITFALKALELAQLVDFNIAGDTARGVELFHDPNKGNNDPNLVKTSKTLKFNVSQNNDGFMLMVSQRTPQQSATITVPISRAEFVVLKNIAAYMMPRMFGFDTVYGFSDIPVNVKLTEDA